MFQDGFGARSLAIDADTGDPVEILTFNPSFAGAPEFGAAVGERVARLARVRHAMYARVRRIERPWPDALLLYSDHVAGWRLAEVLTTIEQQRWTLDISAVLTLLRQLIPAVALFSRHQRDAAIGTIGPERLILTRQGRLAIAEYVLAPGLEALQMSRERLWRELRVAVPPVFNPTRLPPSADVVGIGVVALSLLLGRCLREDEFLVSLGELVDSATETVNGHTRPLTPGFAAWLGRALQFDEHTAFSSTQEAQVAFEEMLAKERSYVTTPALLELFLSRYEGVVGQPRTPPPARTPAAEKPAQSETVTASTASPPAASSETSAPAAGAAGNESGRQKKDSAPAVSPVVAATSPVGKQPASRTPVDERESQPTEAAPPVPPLGSAEPSAAPGWMRWALIAAALTAVIEAGALAWLAAGRDRPGPPLQTHGELTVQSHPLAARVSIDGEDRGVTPLSTELPPGPHVLEVRAGRSEPRVIPILVRAGIRNDVYVELQSVATVGGLEVRSEPARARVTVGGQFRGTTPLVVKDLPPGDTEVVVSAGAHEVRQTVRIEPGITTQLVVPLGR